jgi:hyperosmotically inducible periplasmic protein
MKQLPLLIGSLIALLMASCAKDDTGSSSSEPTAFEEGASKTAAKVEDAAITTKIKSKLLADTEAPGLKINVTTNGGIVTLEGTVKSNQEKQRAEEITRNTQGVSDVRNLLTVSSQ